MMAACKVTAVSGPVLYQVTLADGRLWRRHQGQLLKATNTTDAIQTCKASLKKMSSDSLETKIQRFLLNY